MLCGLVAMIGVVEQVDRCADCLSLQICWSEQCDALFIDSREELQSVGTGLGDETEIEATCRVHPYSVNAVGWLLLRMVHRFRKRFLLKLVVGSRQ